MTYRTQNARLMRRLGFKADPKDKPQIVSAKDATYWRHQPTLTCVVTFHDTRYREVQIVRTAISAGILMTIHSMRDKISSAMHVVEHAHEKQAYEFDRTHR